MPTKQKIKKVDELRAIASETSSVLVVGYRGLNMPKFERLRKALRDAGGTITVVKNSLFRIAVQGSEIEAAAGMLEGPSAIVVGPDAPALAKALMDFAKTEPGLTILGGVLDGQAIAKDRVEAVASIPPREVLYSLLVAGLEGPISGLVNTLKGTISKLVYALEEIEDKKNAA